MLRKAVFFVICEPRREDICFGPSANNAGLRRSEFKAVQLLLCST